MESISVGSFVGDLFSSKKTNGFDEVKNQAQKLAASDKTNDNPSLQIGTEQAGGVKIHVTKEYIKENGSTIVGTKGDDIFLIDADVKNFDIKGNGGNDKIIIRKDKPKIVFPKLPNE